MTSDDSIDLDKGSFERNMRTDPKLYADMKKRIESGEEMHITLPDDSNAPRYSMRYAVKQEPTQESDFEIVNPKDVFGRMFGGG